MPIRQENIQRSGFSKGEISVYSVSGDLPITKLSDENKVNLICWVDQKLTVAFGPQHKLKVREMLKFMGDELYTETQVKDCIDYFIKTHKYADKWTIGQVMAYRKDCLTQFEYNKRRSAGEISAEDYTRFQSPDGKYYYWQNKFGSCPFPEAKLKKDNWIKITKTTMWNLSWGEIPGGWYKEEEWE